MREPFQPDDSSSAISIRTPNRFGPAPWVQEPSEPGMSKYRLLFRRYVLLGVALVLLGALAGVASVVLSSPIYRVRTLLEVQGINEAWLRNSFEQSTSYDSTQANVQTQITLLRQGPFLRRVNERLGAETVPPPPIQSDFFSRLRSHIRKDSGDPMVVMREGLESAFESFDARSVNGTRLIELTCDSTNPQMASQFINTMASEFMDETMRSRSQSSQKTSEWLTEQIEETKIKLQEAEQRLQDFGQRSGNLFVAEDGTLDDSKLKQLRDELSTIQADRIAKQARYEMAVKSTHEALPEVLGDENLRVLQRQITDLRRQKAELDITLTPSHPKVQQLDAQLATLSESLERETKSGLVRLESDFEAARRRESLLSSAYSGQLQRVSSIAGKSAEHNAFKREVDTLRQMYQGLLMQGNQAGLSGSVPVNPIRLVEVTTPPVEPYRPRPILNISFGVIMGLFLTAGIAFMREKMDRSVRNPRITQYLFDVPQLGVIPSATALERISLWGRMRRSVPQFQPNRRLRSIGASTEKALATWGDGPSFIAESFRATLASVMRDPGDRKKPRMILVTSPGPGEGKTTVASNLAMALAETGRKVLLIDADFRRPRLHKVFALSNSRGFIDLLSEDLPLTDETIAGVMMATPVTGLTVLVNRALPNVAHKLLYSPRLRAVLERVRQGFDIVLLDTPPLLHFVDTRLIAPWSDGLILVLRAGATDRESALEACERIREDGLNLLGTVLNDWNPGKSHLKHHYYYEYSDKVNG